MKEYIEKLHTKLHEAMEKPVTLGSAEEVGLYAKTICRLEKLHGNHDEPEAATFDRETAMQWAANMQNADGTTGPHWTMISIHLPRVGQDSINSQKTAL